MELSYTINDGTLVVTPKIAALDARVSREFKEKITDLITSQSASNLVINLQQIQFVDSSGLGAFLAILKYIRSRGGEMKLSAMSKPVRMIFELVAMHKIFDIFDSIESAIDSLT